MTIELKWDEAELATIQAKLTSDASAIVMVGLMNQFNLEKKVALRLTEQAERRDGLFAQLMAAQALVAIERVGALRELIREAAKAEEADK